MTSSEWIELFFSEAYEKQINDLVLEDWDYDVPIHSIRNYVEAVIAIPYTEFIDYVKHNYAGTTFRAADIPQFIKYANCEINLVDYLLGEDNRGCTPTEIGAKLNDLFEKSQRGDISYATRHLGSARILGLAYEYFGHWYLNCLSYVYGSLNHEERNSLVARTMLRSPFFKAIFAGRSRRIVLSHYLDRFSPVFTKKHFLPIVRLIDICVYEAQKSGRKIFFDSRYADRKPIGESFNVDVLVKPSSSRSLARYVEEVKGWYSMSEKDARRLVEKHRKGDRNALEELVKATQPIVIRTASDFNFAPKEDIIQEGNLGLLAGIENFELERQVSLYGYLSFWVIRYIQSYKDSTSNLVRIPGNKFALISSVKEQAKQYQQKHGYMPTCEELDWGTASDEESKIAYDIMMSMTQHDCQATTIDEETLYADENHYSPERNTNLESLNYDLHHLINFLNKREANIVLEYFGMDGKRSETFGNIGSKLGMTRERIRQIFVKCTYKLRVLAKAKYKIGVLSEKEREVLNIMLENRTRAFRADIAERTKEESAPRVEIKPHQPTETTPIEHSVNKIVDEAHRAIAQYSSDKSDVSNSPAMQGAKAGDKIFYNGKICIVLENISRGDSFRLSIKYEDGKIDNIQDNKAKYKIIKNFAKQSLHFNRENDAFSHKNRNVRSTKSLEERILGVVRKHNGIKAIDIARIIGKNRSKINSILYRLKDKGICTIDNNYLWKTE